MIDYERYLQIRQFHTQRGLTFAQIARELSIDPETAAKWARAETFTPRARPTRQSLLDAHKPTVRRLLEHHPYSAVQLLQRLRADEGYQGGLSILKDYVRLVRPPRAPAAFLTLTFAPGECAQVDWGYAGLMTIGSTTRRVSYFLMVLCYSRRLYLEFTLGEATEHFLACHHSAFAFFGGVPKTLLFDNLKTAVVSHPRGQAPIFNARYLDFAAHYGFTPKACNVRRANEKGRVENGIGYVQKNFLNGLTLPNSLSALNLAACAWTKDVANVRVHGETRARPDELFAAEKADLLPLSALPADTGVLRSVRATNRFRVVHQTNRYSVPHRYASARLLLKCYAERLCIYADEVLIATHPRSYERHRDFENPEHVKELLEQRRAARGGKQLQAFYALCPCAEAFQRQLCERRFNASSHVARILALEEIYGREKLVRALEDAFELEAFSSDYLVNLLEARERLTPQPGPLHLTRRADLLELELSAPDLGVYG
jgi:transposase